MKKLWNEFNSPQKATIVLFATMMVVLVIRAIELGDNVSWL